MLTKAMLGPYRVEAKLGEGEMGEVYTAGDARRDRLPSGESRNPGANR